MPEGHLGQEDQKTGGQAADLSGSAENTAETARGQWREGRERAPGREMVSEAKGASISRTIMSEISD